MLLVNILLVSIIFLDEIPEILAPPPKTFPEEEVAVLSVNILLVNVISPELVSIVATLQKLFLKKK